MSFSGAIEPRGKEGVNSAEHILCRVIFRGQPRHSAYYDLSGIFPLQALTPSLRVPISKVNTAAVPWANPFRLDFNSLGNLYKFK